MRGMSETSNEELDQVQEKIDDAKVAAKDLADHDVIDPDAVEGRVPRETEDPADESRPTTDEG